jgi:hypothetical protein
MPHFTIKDDLDQIIKEITDIGVSDVSLSRAEVMQVIVKFYGTIIIAQEYAVITAEEARYLHAWLVNLLGL